MKEAGGVNKTQGSDWLFVSVCFDNCSSFSLFTWFALVNKCSCVSPCRSPQCPKWKPRVLLQRQRRQTQQRGEKPAGDPGAEGVLVVPVSVW